MMNLGYFNYPLPVNEPVLNYAPGSPERKLLKDTIRELKSLQPDIPMYIGGREVRTGKQSAIHPPHEIAHTLGNFHAGDASHVEQAIKAALHARMEWAETSWENRANIFCARPILLQLNIVLT